MEERFPRRENRSFEEVTKVLKKIKEKYIYAPVRDDGNSDALEYASVQANWARESNNPMLRVRWAYAINRATRESDEDIEILRIEIAEEALLFASSGEEGSAEFSNAFRNLADSIVG